MMKCKFCGLTIIGDPTFCKGCRKSTGLLRNELSAIKSLRFSFGNVKWKEHRLLSALLLLPFLAFVFSLFFFDYLPYYCGLVVFLLLFLSPLAQDKVWLKKIYRFVPFSLTFVAYIFLLRLICQGDPILNLVYFIMCNYGLSLSLPIVYKLGKGCSLRQSFSWSFKTIKESRWQQMFLLWALFALNLLAILPVGLGLFFTLPLSYHAISHYGEQLEEHYKSL